MTTGNRFSLYRQRTTPIRSRRKQRISGMYVVFLSFLFCYANNIYIVLAYFIVSFSSSAVCSNKISCHTYSLWAYVWIMNECMHFYCNSQGRPEVFNTGDVGLNFPTTAEKISDLRDVPLSKQGVCQIFYYWGKRNVISDEIRYFTRSQ